jgi:hypothetical protein
MSRRPDGTTPLVDEMNRISPGTKGKLMSVSSDIYFHEDALWGALETIHTDKPFESWFWEKADGSPLGLEPICRLCITYACNSGEALCTSSMRTTNIFH